MLSANLTVPSQVEGRPLRTRAANWMIVHVVNQLPGLNYLARGPFLSNLQAVYNALPLSARKVFVDVIQKPETGVLQVKAHPELFDQVGNLVDFTWVKERNVCKAITLETLEAIVGQFKEVEGYRLAIKISKRGKTEEVSLEVKAPAPAVTTSPAARPEPSGLMILNLSWEELRTDQGQRELLKQVFLRAKKPLQKAEAIGNAFALMQSANIKVPDSKKGRLAREFKESLYAILNQFITSGEMVRTFDGRYFWRGQLSEMLMSGRVKELYVDNENREYISAVALSDFELVNIRVGDNIYLARATNVALLEQKGEVRLVCDVEGGQAVSCCYDVQTTTDLLAKGEVVLGRAGDGKEVYVARRALPKYWKHVYNYQASFIIKARAAYPKTKQEELERLAVALDKAFSFAMRFVGPEAFSLLERSLKVATIGGTDEEILASLLALAPRDKLLEFLPSLAKVFPEKYALLPKILESFYVLRQMGFAVERNPATYLQWYTQFFLSYTNGLPVLKLLMADVLQRLESGVAYDASKIKQIYLQLLDKTVEIKAAAALKNALLRRENPAALAMVRSGMSELYALPFEELGAMLGVIALYVESDLRIQLVGGTFGREFSEMDFFVISRVKTEASVYEKVFVRREYASIEELWDIFGMQIVTPSAVLAGRMAVYLAGKYGVETGEDKKARTPDPLPPAKCTLESLLRVGEVRGPLGQGIEFYKIQSLFVAQGIPPARLEIQVHEEQMFWRYKKGIASTAVYDLQKTVTGLEFEPERLIDPKLPFEEQIRQMTGDMRLVPCVVAGVNVRHTDLVRVIEGEKAVAARGVLPGTKVAELAVDPRFALGGKVVGVEVYRYGVDNNWELKLVPALTDRQEKKVGRAVDAKADLDYEVQPGDVVFFETLELSPSQVRNFNVRMAECALNAYAKLQYTKAILPQKEFVQAVADGRRMMLPYLAGPRQCVRTLEGIFAKLKFVNLEDFLAAIALGFLNMKEVEAEIKKHSIGFKLEEEPGGVKTLSVFSTDVFGLNKYLFDHVIGTSSRLVGGMSLTYVGEGEVRAELVFSLRGRVVLEEDAYDRLNTFLHRQTDVRAYDAGTQLYTLNLKKQGEDWDGFRRLIAFLEANQINILEYDLSEKSAGGYIKMEVPSVLGGQGLLVLLAKGFEVAEETVAV
ncbi:MAG: hypothetical protein NT099_04445 [Candidatus Saganbacteria bacterium]|nr:hypothetical protein [Candidatus Saganbacteria bacterium]